MLFNCFAKNGLYGFEALKHFKEIHKYIYT